MSQSVSTVFIVDDDASVCRSLTRLFRLAGLSPEVFPSGEDFLLTAGKPRSHPSCLITDLCMPGINGLELQRQLVAKEMACPVIFISGNGDIPATVQAMKQGAVTFLTKPFEQSDLLAAVAAALEQSRLKLASDRQLREIQSRIESLTDREQEVMAWVITGALNKQIADKLGIVERTVKVHRARVHEKMKTTSVAELVRYCALAQFLPATG